MGAKEFSKQLVNLVSQAVNDGVGGGHMSFAQIVGTLEMAKADVLACSQELANRRAAAEQRIIIPKAT